MNRSPSFLFPPPQATLTPGQAATLACLMEVAAPKAGNVHRSADFADMTLADFLASAVAIAPAMDEATRQPVGLTVLQAIRATRQVTTTNTNLGTVLLIAPLAAVPREQLVSAGIELVLHSLTAADAADVYEAIRLASPGGLGEVEEMDVQQAPPESLLAAMQSASDYDLVARQYVTGFQTVLDEVVPRLQEVVWSQLPTRIVQTQLELLARHSDSLIQRKTDSATAQKCQTLAQRVLESGPPESTEYLAALEDLDFWLRSDGNRRNPGTTADLIAAGLFVVIRDANWSQPTAAHPSKVS